MNILCICAHPDDIEVNCAGTLLKYHQQGHKIFIALTTSGNTGSNIIPSKAQTAATREAEQLRFYTDTVISDDLLPSLYFSDQRAWAFVY